MEDPDEFLTDFSNQLKDSTLSLKSTLLAMDWLSVQVKDLRYSLIKQSLTQLSISGPHSVFAYDPLSNPYIDGVKNEVNTLKGVVNKLIERIVGIS